MSSGMVLTWMPRIATFSPLSVGSEYERTKERRSGRPRRQGDGFGGRPVPLAYLGCLTVSALFGAIRAAVGGRVTSVGAGV